MIDMRNRERDTGRRGRFAGQDSNRSTSSTERPLTTLSSWFSTASASSVFFFWSSAIFSSIVSRAIRR